MPPAILIRGTLLGHNRMIKEEAREALIEELGADPEDALEEVERIHDAHVRFSFLTRLYEAELLAAQQAACDLVEVEIHRQRVLRCYFLFLLGTQLFVDLSSSYTYIVYMRYLSNTHFPVIIGWGEVLGYTEAMSRASAFIPLRGNQVPDPYMHSLERMAAGDIRYDCYAIHCGMIAWDDIALYSGWLAASSTITVRYLPERVMRQFIYCQTIPHHPSVSTPMLMIRRQIDEVFAYI
ncbi:uncharacterized protein LOC131652953 [Vicia villosa]|uniref:uncharacterized protein LOC131652953 n=1 Tax=Vicia villosa TaxID=3911 RepID=UPI00273B0A6E|nr:uncharacterized protein LOC131652953 [Vicia villosa]